MGERGFPPLPTELLRSRGSWRANDPTRANEPTPLSGEPPAPENLTDDEMKAWDRLIEMLSAMRVISRSDGNALERYVKLLTQWRAAIAFLEKNGQYYTVKDPGGNVKSIRKFPRVNMVLEYGEALLRIERQYGLTPSARARVQATAPEPTPESDGKARFFNRSRVVG
jgi:P27 family predicted phage terminase small subunit